MRWPGAKKTSCGDPERGEPVRGGRGEKLSHDELKMERCHGVIRGKKLSRGDWEGKLLSCGLERGKAPGGILAPGRGLCPPCPRLSPPCVRSFRFPRCIFVSLGRVSYLPAPASFVSPAPWPPSPGRAASVFPAPRLSSPVPLSFAAQACFLRLPGSQPPSAAFARRLRRLFRGGCVLPGAVGTVCALGLSPTGGWFAATAFASAHPRIFCPAEAACVPGPSPAEIPGTSAPPKPVPLGFPSRGIRHTGVRDKVPRCISISGPASFVSPAPWPPSPGRAASVFPAPRLSSPVSLSFAARACFLRLPGFQPPPAAFARRLRLVPSAAAASRCFPPPGAAETACPGPLPCRRAALAHASPPQKRPKARRLFFPSPPPAPENVLK